LVIAAAHPISPSALAETLRYFNGCFDVRCEDSFPAKNVPLTIAHYWLRDRFLPKSVIQFVLYPAALLPGTLLAACLPRDCPLVIETIASGNPVLVGRSFAREIVSKLAGIFSWRRMPGVG
ncbi:MAG TPA: hypothetical protein VF786_11050, partial [Terriglobales bacterium]